jgi:hypothetical protein
MLSALRQTGETHLQEALALAEQAGVPARGELVEGGRAAAWSTSPTRPTRR